MKKRVIVAMSGGVDSSVSAFLLKQKGYHPVGITMYLGTSDSLSEKPTYCSTSVIEDAKRVCQKLDMPHYVLDLSKDFRQKVIQHFINEYAKGRTPNPCVECNRHIKFNLLLKKARALGFELLATGHYARIVQHNNTLKITRPKDNKKDQTYFLYPIKKAALKNILFPLGEFTKDQVRELARQQKLPTAEKKQSQDICFIPHRRHEELLRKTLGAPKQGPIRDIKGNRLGTHKGLYYYTIGQREKLGISHPKPLYVLSINTAKNELIVGEEEQLGCNKLEASNINLFTEKLPKETVAQIRYAHTPALCTVSLKDHTLHIRFKQRQKAVTPGQSVVLYKDNILLGGGIIKRVVK
jgi:tRNA-uridine 2-sulfurtransferase